MNRREFLKASASATALLVTHPAWAAEKEKLKLSDSEILAQTKVRIENHRKGDGVITVRDAKGRPIRGAKVKIEQLRHDFLFGCNFFMFARNGEPHLEEQYRRRFADLLNYCTLGFYWADYERERGKPRYEYTDEVVAFCAQHDITCKGHPLVWDHEVSTPPWLPGDLKEIERLSKARIEEIVSRFKGRIDIWDVVNEATHLHEIKKRSRMDELGLAMGQVAYVADHLKIARAANPSATLLVNDYKIGPNYFELLDKLREKKKLLFDAVGIQSHMHRGVWPLQKVWDTCDTFAKLGLPIHFTETTVVSGPNPGKDKGWGPTTPEDEEKQAKQTVKFYTSLFAHPTVQAITWWDFSDHGAWQGAPAGWLRRDMSPKPVYDRLLSLIKGEWWTKVESQTDWRGRVAAKAFYGKHRVTVELPGGRTVAKEVNWLRGNSNRFEVGVA